MKKTFLKWMLLMPMVLGIGSCSRIDNPADIVIPDNDNPPFANGQYVDPSANPGDDYFRYGFGKWLAAEGDEPCNNTIVMAVMDRFASEFFTVCDDPKMVAMRDLVQKSASDGTADLQLFTERLNRISAIQSQEDLLTVFAELHQLGYNPLLRMVAIGEGGVAKGFLTSGSVGEIVKSGMSNEDAEELSAAVKNVCGFLTMVGVSKERALEIWQNALAVEEKEMALYDDMLNLIRHPREHTAVHRAPASSAERQKFYELIGIGDLRDQIYSNPEDDNEEIVDELISLLLEGSDESVAIMRDYLLYHLMAQDLSLLTALIPEVETASLLQTAMSPAHYYLYRMQAETFGLENVHKQECERIMEEFRVMMANRIQQLDWMSSATKQEAMKKLQQMKFFIGYPDQWNDEYTPEIKGNSLLEAVTGLRQQANENMRNMVGRNLREDGWDMYGNYMNFTTNNAAYDKQSNTLVILPAFLIAPHFDLDQDEAALYGTAAVFGHELCHGFDSEGAQTDEVGNVRDWWMADDKAAFKAKQQQLVALYNQLEAFPGQSADGEKTLAENMADYGGVTLALECYKQRLAQQGISGAAYDEQLRKFFLSWGAVMLSDAELDVSFLESQYYSDEHSASHNRINGIVRLFDEWYKVYDVKSTDQLYLAPADRVRIW